MKKYDQLIFAALLAAVFVLLSATLGVILPTDISVEGSVESEAPQWQCVLPTAPSATTPTVTEPTTQPQATQPSAPEQDTTVAPKEEASTSSSLPQSNEEILAKYSEVMNKAKADSPAFKKIEWQDIPEEKAHFEGKVFSKILPLASHFFKDEATARANPEAKAKGESMEWFPIYQNEKGCMLTDASVIESATCTELADGNVKIVIELKDEYNSEPPGSASTCDSYVGSMFTPIEMASVRDILENDSTVKFIIKNVDFDLTYYDCTAELTYNPTTNEIVELDQFMHLDINIKEGSIVGISAKGKAVLDNYMYISDFQY